MRERTFSPHADFETFLEAAVLTLVAMVLVDGAVAAAAARVRQVSTDRALKEALAALARELAVVLSGALVAADDALDARLLTAVAASPAAARRSSELGRVMVMMVLARRGVDAGAAARRSRRCPGAVHPDVGRAGLLLQLVVRARQPGMDGAQRRRLHGAVHRHRVLHVGQAAVTAEVVVVTPRRQTGQRVGRPEHRQSHRT